MMKYFRLFAIEVKRGWISQIRYPLNFLSGTVSFIVISLLIMFGLSKIAIDIDIINMVYLPIILTMVGTPHSLYRNDVEIGVFEQIYNSGINLYLLYFMRTMLGIVYALVPAAMILLLSSFFSNHTFSLTGTLLALLYMMAQGFSIGMFFLALGYRFRNISGFINVMNFVFIALTFTKPVYAPMKILPFVNVSAISNMTIGGADAVIAVLVVLFWFALSVVLSPLLFSSARKAGQLGMY
jgi:hypothetical protein